MHVFLYWTYKLGGGGSPVYKHPLLWRNPPLREVLVAGRTKCPYLGSRRSQTPLFLPLASVDLVWSMETCFRESGSPAGNAHEEWLEIAQDGRGES